MRKRIPILIGLLLVGFMVWLLITPIKPIHAMIGRLENLGYDFQLRSHILTHPAKPDTSVAIIDIDDKSISAAGRWPWPRDKQAELATQLQKLGATVVVFDILFSEKEDNIADVLMDKLSKNNLLTDPIKALLTPHLALFDTDNSFSQSIAAGSTVLAYSFTPKSSTQNQLPSPLYTLTPEEKENFQLLTLSGYIGNIPTLQQAAKAGGFINIYPDDDGVIRRAPLLIEYEGNVYPSIALQAVLSYLNEGATLIANPYHRTRQLEGIQVGQHVIPINSKGFALIPFIGKSYTFPYYSAIDVLNNQIPQDALLGKIVFIGASATGLGDLVPTAVQNPYPGVEVHASLVNGILQHHFSYEPSWTLGANIFLTVLFGLLAAFIFPYQGPRRLAFIILVFPVGLLYLNNLIWSQTGLVLSFLTVVVLILVIAIFNMLYGYLFETRRREQLKAIFGQYVPENHINEMLKSQGQFGLHGEDRDMSVMFADIHNFTTISEGLSAADLVDMLNTYFTPMTEIIHKYTGTVDKYIGDLIMAFWGAPLQDKQHAYHAMCSALDMQTKLGELAKSPAMKKWPEIRMGIGINTGVMSVGDMGSSFRRNYTVLGDSVNLASRVESLSRYYGVSIMVAENTQRDQTDFVFRKLDRVQVKGKKIGVDIYELIGLKAKTPPEVMQELEQYHAALDLYFQKEWSGAAKAMNVLHQAYPDKKIYKLYLDRIAEYQAQPPAMDWDGTYAHTKK